MFVYKMIRIINMSYVLNGNDVTLHFLAGVNNGWIFGISQMSALWIVDCYSTDPANPITAGLSKTNNNTQTIILYWANHT